MIRLKADADIIAASMLAKARLDFTWGMISAIPHCGLELWDVINITDTVCNKTNQKYRVAGWTTTYDPKNQVFKQDIRMTEL
jgi:hypothetical protein